jgi:POT family proton-dependent oligopeptide transporter
MNETRQNERMPGQIRYIVGNEACERFTYYGIVSVLTLYLKNAQGMGRDEATEVAHLFKMAVYFLPLLGGWLADRWLGRYRTIFSLSLVYCLGPVLLGGAGESRAGLFAGLGLIALGSGGIKPCVSAFVGDQFGPAQQHLLSKAYGWFYWAINLGAFLAFALIPVVRDRAGYGWAFGVPAVFMFLATVVFWAGRGKYTHAPVGRDLGQAGFVRVLWTALMGLGSGRGFWEPARERFSAADVAATRAVLRILGLYAAVPVFWALFEQINTTWVLQGERMRPFAVLGYRVDAERIQSISALLVLIWIPVLTIWAYPWAERVGLRPTPLRRIGTGMFLAALAFVGCAVIQQRLDGGAELSLAWQVLPYVVLEAGEVMVSATGLEFAFSQAPPAMKSTVMSFWLLTISTGNLMVAMFTSLNARFVHARGPAEFLFYAGLMAAVATVFALLAARYRPMAVEGAGGTGRPPGQSS